jgi:2'-5' RNA ligase
MRCFVAIKLPKEVKDEVARVQGTLKSLDLHAKWVEFENLHVTLKFLGDIRQEDLSRTQEIVGGISSFAKSFSLKLSQVGAFPDTRRPRVIWVGIKPQDNPITIIEYLEGGFVKMGLPPEKRSPHPHITIARIKSPKNTQMLESRFSSLEVKEIGWEVEGISLFKSILKSQGPIYEEIFTTPLTS